MNGRHALLVGATTLLLVASVAPAAEIQVVTGHTTFADLGRLDPCLGAIAGVVRTQVLWFDGAILHERTNFDDDRYVYAIQEGAPDPTKHVGFDDGGPPDQDMAEEIKDNARRQQDRKILTSSGTTYDFTDPNGVEWNVTEAYFDWKVRGDPEVNEDGEVHTGDGSGGTGQTYVNATAATVRYFTWIVQIGETVTDDHMDAADQIGHEGVYNFVEMVNTCKFNERADPPTVRNHSGSNSDPPGFQHPNSTEGHEHEAWNVSIHVGPDPSILPLGAETPHNVTVENVEKVVSETRGGAE